jgi:hypothetical protein
MAVGIPRAGDWTNRPALVKMRPTDEGSAEDWQSKDPPLTLTPSRHRAWQAASRRPADAE